MPLSLCTVELACDSSFGRGIFEGLFSKTGTCPLPWPLFGVPLKVPPAADITALGREDWNLMLESVSDFQIGESIFLYEKII